MSSSQWELIIYNNSILWKVSLNGDFPVPEGFDESLFSPIFAKKIEVWKWVHPPPLQNFSARSIRLNDGFPKSKSL